MKQYKINALWTVAGCFYGSLLILSLVFGLKNIIAGYIFLLALILVAQIVGGSSSLLFKAPKNEKSKDKALRERDMIIFAIGALILFAVIFWKTVSLI